MIKCFRTLFCVILLSICMSAVFSTSAHATEETRKKIEQAENEKKQTESELNDTQNNIEGLQGEKNTLQGQLNKLNTELTKVSENLENLEEKIKAKQEEIRLTKEKLEEARQTEEEQYAAMKKRVQYMYESKQTDLFDMIYSASGIGKVINQAVYMEQLSAYDRQKLEEYQANKELIIKNEEKLEQEENELVAYKEEVETEQDKVSGLVNQTSKNINSYSNQIKDAQNKADELEAQINEQEANIEALKKKLEEEIRLSRLAAQSAWRNISEVSFAEGDRELLANLIYCEAGNQGYAGQLGVGSVVINRVLSSVYPNSVVGVIYQGGQFSPVASGRLALALAEGRATQSCYEAADAAMSGQTNVGNCVYFRTPIEGLNGIVIGGHVFY